MKKIAVLAAVLALCVGYYAGGTHNHRSTAEATALAPAKQVKKPEPLKSFPVRDVPKSGDHLAVMANLPDGSTVGVDRDSVKFDKNTKQVTFLVVGINLGDIDDGHGHKVYAIVQRMAIDCVKDKVKFVNASSVDAQDNVLTYEEYNDDWTNIHKTPDGKPTLVMALEEEICAEFVPPTIAT